MKIAERFPIETGIPAPKSKYGNTKYPFERMAVGDSFLVAAGVAHRVSAAASSRAKRHPGEQYVVRTVDGGMRVWRVA